MANNIDDIIIRSATKADISNLYKFYAPTRWNICLDYFDIILHLDEESILIAENKAGEIVGSRLFLLVNDQVALEELYFVREDYRGKGVGTTLTKCGEKRTATYNRCLNSVENMVQKYHEKADYKIISDWKIRRFVGRIENFQIDFVIDFKIVPYSPNFFEEIYQYDCQVLGLPRRKFLQTFLERTTGLIFIALKNNNICGYGAVRDAEEVPFIGPLFADDSNIAKVLLKNLVENFPKAQDLGIYMDTVDKNPYVLKMVEECGLQEIDAYIRMYSKEDIPFNYEKLYVIHSACISY